MYLTPLLPATAFLPLVRDAPVRAVLPDCSPAPLRADVSLAAPRSCGGRRLSALSALPAPDDVALGPLRRLRSRVSIPRPGEQVVADRREQGTEHTAHDVGRELAPGHVAPNKPGRGEGTE